MAKMHKGCWNCRSKPIHKPFTFDDKKKLPQIKGIQVTGFMVQIYMLCEPCNKAFEHKHMIGMFR